MGKKLIVSKSINEFIFIICFCIMIVVTIINGNRFLAGLSFVGIPTMLLMGACLVVQRGIVIPRIGIFAILIALGAYFSTKANSDIAEMSTCINLIVCCVLFALLSNIYLSDIAFSRIVQFYLLFSFVICLILAFNFLTSRSMAFGRVSITVFGKTKDTAYLSALISPAVPINVYFALINEKKKRVFLALFEFVMLFLAGERGSFLSMSLAIAIIVFTFLVKKNIPNKGAIIAGLSILFILGFAIISKSSIFARTTNFNAYGSNIRFQLWGYALQAFWDNPLFGSGVQSGSYYSLQNTPYRTHGCYVDLLTGCGILGVLFFVFILIELLRGYRNYENKLFMIVVVLSFMFPLIFVNGFECATFWTPLSICVVSMIKCKECDNILSCFDNEG